MKNILVIFLLSCVMTGCALNEQGPELPGPALSVNKFDETETVNVSSYAFTYMDEAIQCDMYDDTHTIAVIKFLKNDIKTRDLDEELYDQINNIMKYAGEYKDDFNKIVMEKYPEDKDADYMMIHLTDALIENNEDSFVKYLNDSNNIVNILEGTDK